MAIIRKFYVVFVGRMPGIYENWAEVEAQVTDFPRNVYKDYDTFTKAVNAEMLFYESWQSMSVKVGDIMIRGPKERARSVEEAITYVEEKMKVLDALQELLDGYDSDFDVNSQSETTSTNVEGQSSEFPLSPKSNAKGQASATSAEQESG